jgi:hypothetical protein
MRSVVTSLPAAAEERPSAAGAPMERKIILRRASVAETAPQIANIIARKVEYRPVTSFTPYAPGILDPKIMQSTEHLCPICPDVLS